MSLSLGKAVASLAAVVTLLSAVPMSAQTNGMERRDQRRDVRDASRATKHQLRQGGTTSPPAPAANPAPPANPAQ